MLQFTAFLLHFWSLLAQLFLAPHGLANCFSPESQSPILFSNKHETHKAPPGTLIWWLTYHASR
jgi:hypothetical protein